MWNLKYDIHETSVKQNHGHIEKRIVVAKGKAVGVGEVGMKWQIEVSRCKLLYIEWINDKVLLQRTISNIL